MTKRPNPKYAPLTVGKLHKILGRLINQGAIRRRVCVSKETFRSNLESDGVTILEAHDCRLETIHLADDDGGTGVNKDGSEKYTTVAILFGGSDENNPKWK